MGHHRTPDRTAPVVLDIGGDMGAAVVVTDLPLAGREIEIRADGSGWEGRHVAFADRATPSGDMTAAVFPHLKAGRWYVRLRSEGAVVAVDVAGGKVTTVTFPHPRLDRT